MIHSVGQFQTDHVKKHIREELLPPVVVKALEAKHKQLVDGLRTAQLKMLSYYPKNLHRELMVGLADRDKIGRNSYSNDIFGWMALNVYRHFISQNLAWDCTHHSEDMGYEFFELISQGGDQYLKEPDIESFFQIFPMTAKGKTVVIGHIAEIKEHCREFAKVSIPVARVY
jgi:hypothetical protein